MFCIVVNNTLTKTYNCSLLVILSFLRTQIKYYCYQLRLQISLNRYLNFMIDLKGVFKKILINYFRFTIKSL